MAIIKKIDILNFITNFRKAPNDMKSYKEIRAHLGVSDEAQLMSLLDELKQTKVLKETEVDGEKTYHVVTK